MLSAAALNIEAHLSDSAVSRPLEAGYQDEFYGANFELLGNLCLKPEWAGNRQTGWVDFAIASEKWIVECVRDGEKLEEHIERFHSTGKYRQWINNQEVQEFILLDFRRSIPNKERSMHFLTLPVLHRPPSFLTADLVRFLSNVGIDWLFHVVFADDLSSYTVYDSDCKAVPGETQVSLR